MGRRDVGQRPLVEQHRAVGIAHRTRVLEHDETAAVLALQQQLRIAYFAELRHRLDPAVTVRGSA